MGANQRSTKMTENDVQIPEWQLVATSQWAIDGERRQLQACRRGPWPSEAMIATLEQSIGQQGALGDLMGSDRASVAKQAMALRAGQKRSRAEVRLKQERTSCWVGGSLACDVMNAEPLGGHFCGNNMTRITADAVKPQLTNDY